MPLHFTPDDNIAGVTLVTVPDARQCLKELRKRLRALLNADKEAAKRLAQIRAARRARKVANKAAIASAGEMTHAAKAANKAATLALDRQDDDLINEILAQRNALDADIKQIHKVVIEAERWVWGETIGQ